MSKVVHLSDEAHARAKDFCKAHGLKMSDWVAVLIERALSEAPEEVASVAPVSLHRREVSLLEAHPGGGARVLDADDDTDPEINEDEEEDDPSDEDDDDLDDSDDDDEAYEAEAHGSGDELIRSLSPRKKKLPKFDDNPQTADDGQPIYSQPPFWSTKVK